MSTVPGAVFVLWWITLVLTVVVIVPITIRFLQRTWHASRTISRYAVDTRKAAEGIARNAAGIAALEKALDQAPARLQAERAAEEAAPGAARG